MLTPVAFSFWKHSPRWEFKEDSVVMTAVAHFRIQLTLAFDGSAYQGWQSQRSGRGVQDVVQAALVKLLGRPVLLVGSSRTDAGVHARGLVGHVEMDGEMPSIPLRHLPLSINALLPDDIRVMAAVRKPASFHARFDASGKQYRYRVWNHPSMNPLLRSQAWHVPRALDLEAMREAAAMLVGRHDFRAFTSNRGDLLEDGVRTLSRCEIRRRGHEITFIIEGSGFLYKMCRCIAGTLIQTGEGRFTPADVARMLDGKDRKKAGMNAPAHGLVLWKVYYKK